LRHQKNLHKAKNLNKILLYNHHFFSFLKEGKSDLKENHWFLKQKFYRNEGKD